VMEPPGRYTDAGGLTVIDTAQSVQVHLLSVNP